MSAIAPDCERNYATQIVSCVCKREHTRYLCKEGHKSEHNYLVSFLASASLPLPQIDISEGTAGSPILRKLLRYLLSGMHRQI